ncbi:hypothetical protein FOA43_002934 [Brettanomyces nanus]|uniref:Uncharacterized protein n=1 Tax=Eeniella nana TaxID=13502 RepID=A0A875RVI9_EENNA|nr:uncharacterized protein FOA43_002934 [Brettanomyces nanus]QPG75577.1 hypothetical protein FOA43_002934 [Brettanomyces nanus]
MSVPAEQLRFGSVPAEQMTFESGAVEQLRFGSEAVEQMRFEFGFEVVSPEHAVPGASVGLARQGRPERPDDPDESRKTRQLTKQGNAVPLVPHYL